MKKSFKILGLGLLVLPCMLAMTACSGGALVNTKGNYSSITEASQIAETKSYLNAQGDQDFGTMTGSRMKLTASGKVQGQKMEMSMDAYCTLKDNVLNMSLNYSIQGINMKLYADNNYMYIDMLGQKVKTDTPTDITDIIGSSTGTEGLMFSPSALLDSLEEMENNSLVSNALNYSKSEKNDTTKIKIILNPTIMSQENYTKFEVYFVFEKDEFQGMKIVTGAKTSAEEVNVTIEFVKYEGTVKVPSDLATYPYSPSQM